MAEVKAWRVWEPQRGDFLQGKYWPAGHSMGRLQSTAPLIEKESGSLWQVPSEAVEKLAALDPNAGQVVTIGFYGPDLRGLDLYIVTTHVSLA